VNPDDTDSTKRLRGEQSVADAGLWDGAILRVFPESIAGPENVSLYIESPDGDRFECEVPSATRLSRVAADFFEMKNWPTADAQGRDQRVVVELVNPGDPDSTKRLRGEQSVADAGLWDGAILSIFFESIASVVQQVIENRSRRLSLSAWSLVTFPPEIEQLSWLKDLDLSNNSLSTLPSQIGQLFQLNHLDLSNNDLTELPSEIGCLLDLQTLNLRNNRLTALPPQMQQLIKLQHLDVRGNQLSIPDEILNPTAENLNGSISPATYSRLRHTLLDSGAFSSRNEFMSIFADTRMVPWRDTLPEATSSAERVTATINYLSTSYNSSRENALVLLLRILADRINPSDVMHQELTNLSTELENELKAGAFSASLPSASVILNYYFQLQKSQRPLNEAKVLLVGQGGVGKTSLVNRLLLDVFHPEQTKTEGIVLRSLMLEVKGEEVRLNLWDFGGQEIMHATHQFFLTRRSLYLLVIDARKGEQESNLEYWLQIIESFGGDSPVIIVINKSDEHYLDLDRRGLRSKYPTIRDFVVTSCKEGTGIEKLKRSIRHQLEDMEHISSEWVRSWFEIKTRLERIKRDFISYDKYLDMCHDADVEDPEQQRRLIGFLHDLGVVLNYRDDPRLEEVNILNPEWVTSAVYQIINDEDLAREHGVLRRRDLRRILDHTSYPSTKYDFILGMMRKFEICFPLDDQGHCYLIPDLLSKQEPRIDWPDSGNHLNFHYHYRVLPRSILSRFIVRMQEWIDTNKTWRTGAYLHYEPGNEALVKADLEEGCIAIAVRGNAATQREFLAIIRNHFNHIHRTLARLEVKEMIPVPGHPHIFEEYGYLLKLERKGKEEFYPRGDVEESILIKPLLNGIEPPEMRGVIDLPADFERRLRETLLSTSFFDTPHNLDRLFADTLIAPWSQRVPRYGSPASLVQAVIQALHNQYRSDTHANALVLFLQLMVDHVTNPDRKAAINALARELHELQSDNVAVGTQFTAGVSSISINVTNVQQQAGNNSDQFGATEDVDITTK
jgi:internalin A